MDIMELLNGMLTELSGTLGGILPNLIGAALILIIGWFVAKFAGWVVGKAVTKTKVGSRIGTLTKSSSAKDDKKLGKTVSKIGFYGVFVFVLMAALKALGLESVSEPVNVMVTNIFDFMPTLISAVIVVAAFFFVGKILGMIVTGTTKPFDKKVTHFFKPEVVKDVQIGDEVGRVVEETVPAIEFSKYAGSAVLFILTAMGITQAADTLGLESFQVIVHEIWGFATPLAIGTVIAGAGIFAAGKIAPLAGKYSKVVYVAIGALAIVVGMRQTGLVDNILDVTVPILITLGAAAFAYRYATKGKEAVEDLLA